MNRSILPFRYSFSYEDIDWITSQLEGILRAGAFLTMGPFGEAFEEAFRLAHGSPFAIAVNSGTAALEIILRAVGVVGREVIVPTNTYGATLISVLRAGGVPVLADVAEDMSLDPADAEGRWTDRTAAVVAVHIGGLISPHTRALSRLCEARGVPLVEDAAHAAGASLGGVRAGSHGVAGAFSFFNTKVMTCGEGGMILTCDPAIRDKALLLRDHAKDAHGAMAEPGYNWRLPEVQALLGLRQVRRLGEFIEKRNRIAALYDERLRDVPGVTLLSPPPEAVHNRYKYVIVSHRLPPAALRATLWDEFGIPLGGFVYAIPCHLQRAFTAYADGPYPMAERLCSSHICPPIYQDMTEEEAVRVAGALREVLSR